MSKHPRGPGVALLTRWPTWGDFRRPIGYHFRRREGRVYSTRAGIRMATVHEFHHVVSYSLGERAQHFAVSADRSLRNPERVHVGWDGRSHRYTPRHLRESADQVREGAPPWCPSAKLHGYRIPGNVRGGFSSTIPVVSFAMNQVLARGLRYPWAVSTILANPGRYVIFPSGVHEHRVGETQILAVLTRRANDTTSASLHGSVYRRSASMGVEFIRLLNGVGASAMIPSWWTPAVPPGRGLRRAYLVGTSVPPGKSHRMPHRRRYG